VRAVELHGRSRRAGGSSCSLLIEVPTGEPILLFGMGSVGLVDAWSHHAALACVRARRKSVPGVTLLSLSSGSAHLTRPNFSSERVNENRVREPLNGC
jgi:hypothetical protein